MERVTESTWDPIEAAGLLRRTARDLERAGGLERNALFLELHRLQDTIFRLALEEHPAAPPTLAAQAFSRADPLPAPQVIRELDQLRSTLIDGEIRQLYQHVNAARNNLAHEAILERVTVSPANVGRMVRLADRVADQLDPHREAAGEPPVGPQEPGHPLSFAGLLYLLAGLALGLFLGMALF